MSEKIISDDESVNENFIEFYYNFKRMNGYSELEISQKREALENTLVPFKVQKNIEMLRNAGFEKVEIFFQWYNFISILAIK